MPKIVDSIKNTPWKAILAGIAVIPALITIIYFVWDVSDMIVTQKDLTLVKNEIINELRDESAKIRVAYLRDLESRLEDVEVEMEILESDGKPISEVVRRKAKRLQRRIEEISSGS